LFNEPAESLSAVALNNQSYCLKTITSIVRCCVKFQFSLLCLFFLFIERILVANLLYYRNLLFHLCFSSKLLYFSFLFIMSSSFWVNNNVYNTYLHCIFYQVFHGTKQPVIPNPARCLDITGSTAYVRSYEEHGPRSYWRSSVPYGTCRDIWHRCYVDGWQSVLSKLMLENRSHLIYGCCLKMVFMDLIEFMSIIAPICNVCCPL